MDINQDLKYAVLIDADNISNKYVKLILDEVANYGVATYRRIYGDWTDQRLSSWKSVLLDNSISPIQQYGYTVGKNSTDSAMIIDAMDILYSGSVNGFCIISSDSDFTRLVVRLRESGMNVIGMGESKTPRSFIAACNQFKYLDKLYQTSQKAERKARRKSPKSSSGSSGNSGNAGNGGNTAGVPAILPSGSSFGSNQLTVINNYAVAGGRRRQGKDIRDGKDIIRDDRGKDARDGKDIRDDKGRDVRDGKDIRDDRGRDARDGKDIRDDKGRDARDGKDIRDDKGRDARDGKDVRDDKAKDARDGKDLRESKDVKEAKTARDTREGRGAKDNKDSKKKTTKSSKSRGDDMINIDYTGVEGVSVDPAPADDLLAGQFDAAASLEEAFSPDKDQAIDSEELHEDNAGDSTTDLEEITAAIEAIVEEGSDDDGWLFSANLGNILAKRYPDFDVRNYGYTKLTPFIESLGAFDVKLSPAPGNSNVKHVYVRVRPDNE